MQYANRPIDLHLTGYKIPCLLGIITPSELPPSLVEDLVKIGHLIGKGALVDIELLLLVLGILEKLPSLLLSQL